MDPQTGRVAFKIGFFITFLALLLLLIVKPGTTEFNVTILCLLIGLIFLGVVAFIVRRTAHK